MRNASLPAEAVIFAGDAAPDKLATPTAAYREPILPAVPPESAVRTTIGLKSPVPPIDWVIRPPEPALNSMLVDAVTVAPILMVLELIRLKAPTAEEALVILTAEVLERKASPAALAVIEMGLLFPARFDTLTGLIEEPMLPVADRLMEALNSAAVGSICAREPLVAASLMPLPLVRVAPEPTVIAPCADRSICPPVAEAPIKFTSPPNPPLVRVLIKTPPPAVTLSDMGLTAPLFIMIGWKLLPMLLDAELARFPAARVTLVATRVMLLPCWVMALLAPPAVSLNGLPPVTDIFAPAASVMLPPVVSRNPSTEPAPLVPVTVRAPAVVITALPPANALRLEVVTESGVADVPIFPPAAKFTVVPTIPAVPTKDPVPPALSVVLVAAVAPPPIKLLPQLMEPFAVLRLMVPIGAAIGPLTVSAVPAVILMLEVNPPDTVPVSTVPAAFIDSDFVPKVIACPAAE